MYHTVHTDSNDTKGKTPTINYLGKGKYLLAVLNGKNIPHLQLKREKATISAKTQYVTLKKNQLRHFSNTVTVK